MQIRDLEWFIAVAKTENLSRAAEQLFVTQPALSRKIQEMEREYHTSFFIRTRRGVRLTENGEIFYLHAKKIVNEYITLQNELNKNRLAKEGSLIIGCNPIMGQPQYLVNLLKSMKHFYPDIKISFQQAPSPELIGHMAEGKIDFCFTTERHALGHVREIPTLTWEYIHPIRYYALLPKDHRLAKKETVSFQDLPGEKFIMLRRELIPNSYEMIVNACQKAGFAPAVVQQADNLSELVLMVRAEQGIAVISSVAESSDTICIPIPEYQLKSVRVLAWCNDNANPCIEVFRSMIRQSRNFFEA